VLLPLFVILNLVVRCTPSAPASYYLSVVGIKILKQVQDDDRGCQDDGGWFLDERWMLGRGRTPSIFFVPLWLCARYIGAASGFGGAAWSRAMGGGSPLTQWSLSDQSGGPPLAPPACGRGILVWFCDAGPSVSRSGCHLPIASRWRGIGGGFSPLFVILNLVVRCTPSAPG
jgi:hypothetical protein